eukprot:TRINITY_DN3310_c0_g1_i2.p1 TRINITY_DN3310_c0_g1~~TRINITY_DN3310_c0_g1_i2.p1  ORF type:complete len:252 (-),score=45.71 TRINITY_DN3310_c0_g1_i2:305-1060(-)
MEDERDAEDAIRGLDNTEFGRQRRRLCVEWTKHPERGSRRSDGGRRAGGSLKPTKTLFVINFDPYSTRVRDIERHFEPYGRLLNVRIRRNFAFVQYETQEEATKALDNTHLSKLFDRVITVEYAQREDGERRGGRSSPPRRGRYGRSDDRERDRSLSPAYGRRATRGSPDYGRAPSPLYVRRTERRSPDYGRASSPEYSRRQERSSPDYGRPGSPGYERRPQRDSPDYGRPASPSNNVRERSRSPLRENGQ